MDASQDVSSELTNKLSSLTAYTCASHAGMCFRYDINDMISGKLQLQLVPDEGQSHIMGDIDFKVGTPDAITTCAICSFAEAAAGPGLEQPSEIGQWWLLR